MNDTKIRIIQFLKTIKNRINENICTFIQLNNLIPDPLHPFDDKHLKLIKQIAIDNSLLQEYSILEKTFNEVANNYKISNMSSNMKPLEFDQLNPIPNLRTEKEILDNFIPENIISPNSVVHERGEL
ncbi:hypothetical protein M0813_19427 [Anaeramoeba flamelloides]|uniref:Uncharacterized protein n=1 Tax=Anaeramoeba flamelloides TaxID=1746091 RepID=A0ABQ8YNV5_9EUKA|nr:hypothetical protein M0813_19427 [Anaeramoeba flamelloides]